MFRILDNTGNLLETKKVLASSEKEGKKFPILGILDTCNIFNPEFLNSTFGMSLPNSFCDTKEFVSSEDFLVFLKEKGTKNLLLLINQQESSLKNSKSYPEIVAQTSDLVLLNSWSQKLWSGDCEFFFKSLFAKKCEVGSNSEKTEILIIVNIQDSDDKTSVQVKNSQFIKNKLDLIYQNSCQKEGKTKMFQFSVKINHLPHPKYHQEDFKEICQEISGQIFDHLLEKKSLKSSKQMALSTFLEEAEKLGTQKKISSETKDVVVDSSKANNDMVIIDNAFSGALRQSATLMSELTKLVDENNKIPGFGAKSNEIMDNTLELFEKNISGIEKDDFILHKKQELEAIIDTSLSSIFLKQLSIIRELAIAHFKAATGNEDVPVDFAFFTADSFFVREAEDSVRTGSSWSYSAERTNVHNTIREISNRRKQLISEKIQHAEHQANAFQYLQMQQAQMQAIQQQQYGGGAGNWNIGAAYRPPDSNLNISMGYQQGRTNIQISMVPDEQASLLGPNGFTAGVGPANMGVSLNLNL